MDQQSQLDVVADENSPTEEQCDADNAEVIQTEVLHFDNTDDIGFDIKNNATGFQFDPPPPGIDWSVNYHLGGSTFLNDYSKQYYSR